MSEICAELHHMLNKLPKFQFPFDERKISENGLYILFEKGETGHDTNRIVRVGTHTGEGKLSSRLKEHFVNENKDRSIFRKNIGRAILNKANDPFLNQWEMKLISKAEKAENWHNVDHKKKKIIEKQVTDYIQSHFWFVVLAVNPKESRLKLESRVISTVSRCNECSPSMEWLGLHSPKVKIQVSGLWLVNELYREPFSRAEFDYFMKLFSN